MSKYAPRPTNIEPLVRQVLYMQTPQQHDVENAYRRVKQVIKVLENNEELGTKQCLVGGSLVKETALAPLKDIDVYVFLNTNHWDEMGQPGAHDLLEAFLDRIQRLKRWELLKGYARVPTIDLYSYLDAGTVLQPDLLSGQYQGGAAMGIGYALLEDLPLTRGGAGMGRWNLNRYHVALASDVPLRRLELELMPSKKGAPAKGIAEAVLCPIAPAITNAIADATGLRFTRLPVTAQDILRGWSQKS